MIGKCVPKPGYAAEIKMPCCGSSSEVRVDPSLLKGLALVLDVVNVMYLLMFIVSVWSCRHFTTNMISWNSNHGANGS